MATAQKVKVVEELKEAYAERAKSGGGLIFADYRGLTVAELTKLRRALRAKSGSLKVLKNTLVNRALEELGVKDATSLLKGPTVVAFTPDEVSAPKVMASFAKEVESDKTGKFVIKGGVIGGQVISAKDVAVLAALPSREEVYAKLLALINAPATSLLRLIQEPAARTARVVNAVAAKAETPAA